MNRLIAALSAIALSIAGLVASPVANAADYVNIEKPAGNSSTLSSITYFPDRVNAGDTYNFLVNGSTSASQSFFGCYAVSDNGVLGELQVGSNLWAGGVNLTAVNMSEELRTVGFHLWYADDSNVPADCSWADENNAHLQTFVTVLPSNITCQPITFVNEGEWGIAGNVEYRITENDTAVLNGDNELFWFDEGRGQMNVTLEFITDVYGLGVVTAANADGRGTDEKLMLEAIAADGSTLDYREYLNIDMSETLHFDEAVSEVVMSYDGVGSLIGLCVFVDSNVDECVPTVVEDGEYTFVSFPAGVECEWTVPNDVEEIDYVIVGGGAGGGGGSVRNGVACSLSDPPAHPRFGGGGAGGAGGSVREGNTGVTPGEALTIYVGNGGAGGAGGLCPIGGFGTAGEDGEYGEGSWIANVAYVSGGSGGDGAYTDGRAGSYGGANSSNIGGSAFYLSGDCSNLTTTACWAAPGGAGAGTDGADVVLATNELDTFGGNGGDGVYVELLDSYFGGGGAGNIRHCFSNPAGTRGIGTGGLGGGGGTPGTPGGGDCVGINLHGTHGFGGGGAGGRGNGSTAANNSNAFSGGNGGNGTVVIRYLTPNNEPVVIDVNSGSTTMKNSQIDWTIESGADQIIGYKVKLNGQLVTELEAEALGYKLTGLKKNTQYTVEIIPVTADGEVAGFSYTFHTPNEIIFKVGFESNNPALDKFAKILIMKKLRAMGADYSNARVSVTGWVNYKQPVNYAIKQLAVSRAVNVKKFIASKRDLKIRTAWAAPKRQNWQSHRVARVVITYTPAVVLEQ